MRTAIMVLSFLLAALFVFFGVQKFGPENLVFEILAENSGMALFEPYARIATGIAEFAAAVMLAIPKYRKRGALLGLAILIGAVGFHLSPWLGIAPEGVGPGLFYTAVAMLAGTLALNVMLRKA